MLVSKMTGVAIAITFLLGGTLTATAQQAASTETSSEAAPLPSAAGETAPEAAAPKAPVELHWSNLPFESLTDFEAKVPIGMTQKDLVKLLGKPGKINAGRGSDQIYMYEYSRPEGGGLIATIVVQKKAVLLRRLYIRE